MSNELEKCLEVEDMLFAFVNAKSTPAKDAFMPLLVQSVEELVDMVRKASKLQRTA